MSRDEICQIYFGNIEALLGPFEHYTLYIPLLRLYWDRLNIIQLQARSGISYCLLIQPPPPEDFLQHAFGFENTENIIFEVCYDPSCGKPTVDSVASCWGVFPVHT